MLAVSKDKTQYMSVAVFNPDWYNIYDSELVGKIISYYPTFDWVLDDDGEPIDVTYTGEAPEPSIDEKIEKNTADIAYIAMMTDVDIED